MSAYTNFLVFSGGAITQAKSGDTVSMAASLTLTSTAGLVINSGGAADLTIAETGLSRSNADIALSTGVAHKVALDGSLSVAGSMTVTGNLTVSGDIISAVSKNVLIGDSFVDLNAENGTTSAKAGGFTVQVSVGTNFNNTGGGRAPIEVNQFFTTGGGGGSYPYFAVDAGDEAFFPAGTVIAIKGALNAGVDNNGLFVVQDNSTSGQVAVKNAAITQLPFIQTAFAAYTPGGAEAYAYGVNLAAFAISNGSLNNSGGAITVGHPCYVYAADATQTTIEGDWVDLVGSTVTLQNAYDGGSTITLTNGNDLTVNVPVSSGTAGILLNAKGVASNFTVDASTLTLSTTTSGTLTISGYGDTSLDSTNGVVNIAAGNYTGAVNIGTLGARTITVGSSSATKLQLNARTVFDTTAGALGIGYDGVTFAVGVAAGDVVYKNSSGDYAESDQAAGNVAVEVVGVAVDISAGILHTILGGIVGITFASAPSASTDISKAVYLSNTTGQATLTAPSSGRVVRLGNLHSNTALSGSIYPVVWNPQVIADL